MYKNIKVEMIVKMLKEWRKPLLKTIKDYEHLKMNGEYWKGELKVIDHLLEIIKIYK